MAYNTTHEIKISTTRSTYRLQHIIHFPFKEHTRTELIFATVNSTDTLNNIKNYKIYSMQYYILLIQLFPEAIKMRNILLVMRYHK